MAAAALVPALCEPANSQFFLPKAMGRMVFSKQLVITFRQSKNMLRSEAWHRDQEIQSARPPK